MLFTFLFTYSFIFALVGSVSFVSSLFILQYYFTLLLE
nr:MAG TPA: hypothetical protein [Caudoviricetes sp.]